MVSDEFCNQQLGQQVLAVLIAFLGHRFFGIVTVIRDRVLSSHDAPFSRSRV